MYYKTVCRCRSAFKLLELDERFKFLQPGQVVIDCGASPGSWTQVAVKKVNADGLDPNKPIGLVISVDKQQIFKIDVIILLTKIQELLHIFLGCYSIRKC